MTRWIGFFALTGALAMSSTAWAQAAGTGTGSGTGSATGAGSGSAAGAGSGSGSAAGSGSGAGSGSATGSGSGSDDLGDITQALGADAASQKQAHPAADASAAATSASVGASPGQSMNPDLSFIADFAVASFSGPPGLEGGDHDPHQDGFNLQAFELAASKAVDPYFKFNANLNFSDDGVEIEEAYATTLALPYNLQVRAGKFLTQFGRINATHPHTWDFADMPFAISRIFGSDGNRGVGAEVSYLTPLPWYVEIVASANDPRGDQARSFLPESATVSQAWNAESVVAAKQFFELNPNLSLLWGLSWADGPHDGDSLRTHLFGTDLYLKYRPITFGSNTIVSLQSEWIYRSRDELGGAIWDVNGYAQLFWRFEQRWGAGLRYEYGSPARRNGMVVIDPLDPEWTGDRNRAAAAITFWPTEFSRLRAQVQVDKPEWLTNPAYSAFLTLELSLGVHGAHKF